MNTPVQLADALLNATWLLLAVAALVSWSFHGRSGQRWRALLALVCAAVLLFPAISISDDLAEQQQTYDATDTVNAKAGKELKQVPLELTLPVAATGTDTYPLFAIFRQQSSSQGIQPTSSLGSNAGIHSPPTIL